MIVVYETGRYLCVSCLSAVVYSQRSAKQGPEEGVINKDIHKIEYVFLHIQPKHKHYCRVECKHKQTNITVIKAVQTDSKIV